MSRTFFMTTDASAHSGLLSRYRLIMKYQSEKSARVGDSFIFSTTKSFWNRFLFVPTLFLAATLALAVTPSDLVMTRRECVASLALWISRKWLATLTLLPASRAPV